MPVVVLCSIGDDAVGFVMFVLDARVRNDTIFSADCAGCLSILAEGVAVLGGGFFTSLLICRFAAGAVCCCETVRGEARPDSAGDCTGGFGSSCFTGAVPETSSLPFFSFLLNKPLSIPGFFSFSRASFLARSDAGLTGRRLSNMSCVTPV